MSKRTYIIIGLVALVALVLGLGLGLGLKSEEIDSEEIDGEEIDIRKVFKKIFGTKYFLKCLKFWTVKIFDYEKPKMGL